ncbi:MAG: acetate--CoA ligase family protein [Magnetococcales bacterium]|nr:acetate--CoA ligase family protein [Magnetococcales bacterium]
MNLDPLFSPRSMAIVGASRHPEKLGHTLLANAIASGFAGTLYVVHPEGGTILGQTVLPNLAACPRGVELVVLAVPTALVLEQARKAISRGCTVLAVLTDGFRETDEEGAQREAALVKLCQEREVLLLGPNSLGFIHRQHGLNVSLIPANPPAGGISLLSQSGAVCAAALDWMASRNLGISKMVSLGNQAGITDAQFMSYLARDPHTRVIACYLEWLTDGGGFLKAATEASRSKPVVVLLGGSSEWYKRTPMHRSGYLIHSPAVFTAACDRTGLIQTTHFQEWLDALMALTLSALPANNRVAVITNGTGPGMLTSDMLDRHGLNASGLSPALAEPLLPLLPRCSSLQGPLDLSGIAQPHHFRSTVEAAMQDDRIDAMVVVVTPQSLTRPTEIIQSFPVTDTNHKPLLTVMMGGAQMRDGVMQLDQVGLASYPTPERAATAMAILDQYSRWRRRAPRIVTQFTVNPSRVRRLLQRCATLDIQHLTDLESKQILQAYGIVIPEGEEVGTLDEALAMAERVGYPVTLHLISPELHMVHDMNTRHVGVTGAQAVRDGFDLLTLRFANRVPQGRVEGIFVEKTLAHGRPLLIGMKRDQQFGPLLHVGNADSLALEDSLCQLAPVTGDEAVTMLRTSCRQRQMNEATDEMSENELRVVAEVLQRISQLAMDFPEIVRIQINPLVVRRSGLLPVAAECDMQLRAPGETP